MCSNVGLADIGTLTVINVSPNKVWLWRPILLNPHTGTLAHETTTLCVRSHSGPYPGSALRPHPGPLPCPVPPLFPAGQLLTRNLQSISWLHARAMFLVLYVGLLLYRAVIAEKGHGWRKQIAGALATAPALVP